MKYKKISFLAVLVIICGFGISSCAEHDWDEFKKYTASGEIIYPGKIQSPKVFSGENRVRVTGSLSADPKVKEYRIFWSDYADSVSFDATEIVKPASFDHILEVSEGVKTFTFHTYDEFGNKSVGVHVIGTSYGDKYRTKVINRGISSISFNDTSSVINWAPIDVSTGAQYTSVMYSLNGSDTTIETSVSANITVLDGLLEADSASIQYHTVYRPDDECIDLFLSESIEYSLIEEE